MTDKREGLSGTQIRQKIGHPVVDADGHWLEPGPLFLEYLRETGGEAAVTKLLSHQKNMERWYNLTPQQRQASRSMRSGWWTEPTNTRDRATAMLPALLRSRLDEFGIDVGIIYPSLGVVLLTLADDELRRAAVRATNIMTAELFRPHADRLVPVAVVSTQTPEEAVASARHAVEELGFRAIVIGSGLRRPLKTDIQSVGSHGVGATGMFIDTLGMDSAYDYDPFWQACIDLNVAVTAHSGAIGWPDRQSPSNYVYNHMGHFAAANDAFCKSLLLGGVMRRFPALNVGFLEGGTGWSAKLFNDLRSHWNTRSPKALAKYLSPRNVDTVKMRELILSHGHEKQRAMADQLIDHLNPLRIHRTREELAALDDHLPDDFAAAGIDDPAQFAQIFDRFFFGCEADDPSVAWAYHPSAGTKLRPIFGSDIGHFDVVDMSGVLCEAYELVEHGHVSPEQFREFTYLNAALLHTRMNPDFFKGTILEQIVLLDLPRTAGRQR